MAKHARDTVSAIKWNERLIRSLRTTPDLSWSAEDRRVEIENANADIRFLLESDCQSIWNLSNNRFTTTNSMTAV